MGTPDYIAPEQIEAPRTVDIRADIYSLGCTLYFLLAGRPPMPGDTMQQKLAGHLLGKAEPLAGLRPDLPSSLAAVVQRMMAPEPSRRYATPAEVAAALVPFFGGLTGTLTAKGGRAGAGVPDPDALSAPPTRSEQESARPVLERLQKADLLNRLKRLVRLHQRAGCFELAGAIGFGVMAGGVGGSAAGEFVDRGLGWNFAAGRIFIAALTGVLILAGVCWLLLGLIPARQARACEQLIQRIAEEYPQEVQHYGGLPVLRSAVMVGELVRILETRR
jgi:hypothetical protein